MPQAYRNGEAGPSAPSDRPRILGVHHEASPLYAFGFLSLVAAVSLAAALALLDFFVISLGLATSGGTTPVQNLPGIRALLFYGGRLDAGPGTAPWVLAAYLAGSVLIGSLVPRWCATPSPGGRHAPHTQRQRPRAGRRRR